MHPVRLPVKSNTASPIGIAVKSIPTIAFNVIPNPVYNMASGVSAVRNPAVKHCQSTLFAINICTNANPSRAIAKPAAIAGNNTTPPGIINAARKETKANPATIPSK